MIAVVDSGPLYAAADMDDAHHEEALRALARPEVDAVIPSLVVGEASRAIRSRLGPGAEALFLGGVAEMEVEPPTREDWRRIAYLVGHAAGATLDATDASIIALAERLNATVLITLDRRRFGAIRLRHCASLAILP
jgi:predicted nucleic acid-binding protein